MVAGSEIRRSSSSWALPGGASSELAARARWSSAGDPSSRGPDAVTGPQSPADLAALALLRNGDVEEQGHRLRQSRVAVDRSQVPGIERPQDGRREQVTAATVVLVLVLALEAVERDSDVLAGHQFLVTADLLEDLRSPFPQVLQDAVHEHAPVQSPVRVAAEMEPDHPVALVEDRSPARPRLGVRVVVELELVDVAQLAAA